MKSSPGSHPTNGFVATLSISGDRRWPHCKYYSTLPRDNMFSGVKLMGENMVPDPFINEKSELPKPPEKRIVVNLDAVGEEPVVDASAATAIAGEIVAYFEAQPRWKSVKAQSLKAFAVARFYADAVTPIPANDCKAIAHALGAHAHVTRRVRATNAALLESDAWARDKVVTVEELADAVGLRPRALRYLRGKHGYQVSLLSGRVVFGTLRDQGLLEGRRTDNLADYIATPAMRFLADPEESDRLAQATLVALRRFGGEPPVKLRITAYDLVVGYSLVFMPIPRHVLEVLAVALGLVNLRSRIPYAGKE